MSKLVRRILIGGVSAIALASVLGIGVSANSIQKAPAVNYSAVNNYSATPQNKIRKFRKKRIKKYTVIPAKIQNNKIRRTDYHLGQRAGDLDIVHPSVYAKLAAHRNPSFLKGYSKTAKGNYENSPKSLMNKVIGMSGRTIDHGPLYQKALTQAKQDEKSGLQSLSAYYHGSKSFKAGWKYAVNPASKKHHVSKAFNKGFKSALKYMFGNNLTHKDISRYMHNPSAIARDEI